MPFFQLSRCRPRASNTPHAKPSRPRPRQKHRHRKRRRRRRLTQKHRHRKTFYTSGRLDHMPSTVIKPSSNESIGGHHPDRCVSSSLNRTQSFWSSRSHRLTTFDTQIPRSLRRASSTRQARSPPNSSFLVKLGHVPSSTDSSSVACYSVPPVERTGLGSLARCGQRRSSSLRSKPSIHAVEVTRGGSERTRICGMSCSRRRGQMTSPILVSTLKPSSAWRTSMG